jgi:hypothetical protein
MTDHVSNHAEESVDREWDSWRRVLVPVFAVVLLAIITAEPALAQATPSGSDVGSDFCSSNLADTIRNIFTVIQFGGPLLGGVIALGTTVAIPALRRADTKKELKSMRAQALVWGVLVAPLGTTILRFLLGTVVSGGSTCSF